MLVNDGWRSQYSSLRVFLIVFWSWDTDRVRLQTGNISPTAQVDHQRNRASDRRVHLPRRREILNVKQYPSLFSAGLFSKEGPSRQQIMESFTKLTFYADGWKKKAAHSEKQVTKPDKKLKLTVTGPEVAYALTTMCMVQAALTVLQDSDRLPFQASQYHTDKCKGGFAWGQYMRANRLTHALEEDQACAERITHAQKQRRRHVLVSGLDSYMLLYRMYWPRVNPRLGRSRGGVYTPGVAFDNTRLQERLEKRGMTFTYEDIL
ncbi:hypothetical protein AVEN_157680-1 [Araneus ventricosus]|uniref:Uncharacterized protein n=1 Tax=Araneus ventricosus TaxID=182803 RepID=A0A4Y2J2C1_ARAVE|nr:hypothetical protein AVEN_157680-1 [Araneus ventricosus]